MQQINQRKTAGFRAWQPQFFKVPFFCYIAFPMGMRWFYLKCLDFLLFRKVWCLKCPWLWRVICGILLHTICFWVFWLFWHLPFLLLKSHITALITWLQPKTLILSFGRMVCNIKIYSSPMRKASINADCGTSTLPNWRIRCLPFFCLSRSLRLRVMSPP